MRSILFLPTDKIERLPKALGSGADKVIFDLEDGLAGDKKNIGRSNFADLAKSFIIFFISFSVACFGLGHFKSFFIPKEDIVCHPSFFFNAVFDFIHGISDEPFLPA